MCYALDRRGFMTHKGIPDGSRAARLILKDYVNGKLLYCYPPPAYDAEEFQDYATRFHLDADDDDDDAEETSDAEAASGETTSKVNFVLFTKVFVCKQFFFVFVAASFPTVRCRSTILPASEFR